jgi:hypothetical protein
MQYLLLVYIDPELLGQLPPEGFNAHMRGCLQKADALRVEGALLDAQQLEAPAQAKSVRVRNGRVQVLDGPFAETKEVLAGFNLVEAASMEAALRMAQDLPWNQFGCIEVRQVADMAAMRSRVGA